MRQSMFKRTFIISVIFALLGILTHLSFIPFHLSYAWIVPQLLSSLLIYFCFVGSFACLSFYSGFFAVTSQMILCLILMSPLFQFFYYQTYKSFLDQQTLSVIIREPLFLLKVFVTEMNMIKAVLLIGTYAAIFYVLQLCFPRRAQSRIKKIRPFDFFTHELSIAFMIIMATTQITWSIGNDLSQLMMRPFYPVVIFMLISFVIYLIKLVRINPSIYGKVLVCAVILFANISQLYSLNLNFLEYRGKFSFDNQYYRSLFGAYFVQAAFGDMQQDEIVRKNFREFPAPKLDYNILVSLNDSQRWDISSTNGNPEDTDAELKWFLDQAHSFQFPISPANFTDTAVPAILSGLASDQDVKKIKSSFMLNDYYGKTAETFFISSQDITWSKLDLFYKSVGTKHVWSWTAQPTYSGNPEDTNDRPSMEYLARYTQNKSPFVGIWQTFASHAPYTTDPEFQKYLPCDQSKRNVDKKYFRNCYLNAQLFSAHLRSELFKQLPLDKTIIIMTSDHGEGMGEHGIWYHGVDYHQEMVKVPLVIYIPPNIWNKLDQKSRENFIKNKKRVNSLTDIVPTLLHLHFLLTGESLHPNLNDFSGKSLFTDWDHRVVFSSHCFPQYRCYSREVLFADDDYFVLFRPSEGFYKIYKTWEDLEQKHPMDLKNIDRVKFNRLVDEAAKIHPLGQSMKAYYQNVKDL